MKNNIDFETTLSIFSSLLILIPGLIMLTLSEEDESLSPLLILFAKEHDEKEIIPNNNNIVFNLLLFILITPLHQKDYHSQTYLP